MKHVQGMFPLIVFSYFLANSIISSKLPLLNLSFISCIVPDVVYCSFLLFFIFFKICVRSLFEQNE